MALFLLVAREGEADLAVSELILLLLLAITTFLIDFLSPGRFEAPVLLDIQLLPVLLLPFLTLGTVCFNSIVLSVS